jgi:hypothetical protein
MKVSKKQKKLILLIGFIAPKLPLLPHTYTIDEKIEKQKAKQKT